MKTPLCALILLLTIPQSLAAKGPTASQVKKLVAEYVKDDTEDDRRKEILTALGKAKPKLLKSPLASAMKREGTRGFAIDAAVALKAPGLFATARKYIDEDEQKVIALGLLTRDRGASAWLFARWKKAKADSESFKLLTEAFSKYRVEIRTVFRFGSMLRHKQKKVATGKILQFQMDTGTDDPRAIARQWGKLAKELKIAATRFKIRGVDLIALGDAQVRKGRKVGGNYRLYKGGRLLIEDFPDWVNTCQMFQLTLRIYLPVGEKAKVRFENSKTKGFTFQIEGEKWYVKVNDEVEREAVMKVGEWNEFVWKIERLKKSPKKRPKVARENNAWINKIQMLEESWFDHQVGKLIVHCGQERGIVVGGIDLVRMR